APATKKATTLTVAVEFPKGSVPIVIHVARGFRFIVFADLMVARRVVTDKHITHGRIVTVDNFLRYYESKESRPVFSNVGDMLKWADLYNLTTQALEEELVGLNFSPLLMQELITDYLRAAQRVTNMECTTRLNSYIWRCLLYEDISSEAGYMLVLPEAPIHSFVLCYVYMEGLLSNMPYADDDELLPHIEV
ncbi:hypothetical protein M8C21_016294, partial [Ambrosia artemisiifolia]